MKLFPAILLLFVCHSLQAQLPALDLRQASWWLKDENAVNPAFPGLVAARVPGSVYTDLLQNRLIEDPYISDHEKTVSWVEEKDWTYLASFQLTAAQANHPRAVLVFEGIDTYADVYLNGKWLFRADNMFRRWETVVSGKLKVGKNRLTVLFKSTTGVARALAKRSPLTLPGGEGVYVRKAPYQFGWDWAPRLPAGGIWKPVRLTFPAAVQLGDVKVEVPELSEQQALVRLSGRLKAPAKTAVIVRFDISKDTFHLQRNIAVAAGQQHFETSFVIQQPQRWWPNGWGEAHLYRLKTSLLVKDRILEQQFQDVGLRKIRWLQPPDPAGTGFYCEVNDKAIFIKGANLVPADIFPHRVLPGTYEALTDRAKSAHLNMLRIWGGGIYADDALMTACDRAGILVWQDFMFACALYPADSDFLENIEAEARQQILRLRNHPSLALWCGNNEISEGWFNWHWQETLGYSEKDSLQLYQDYQKIFHKLLPELVNELDGDSYYHPSSPANGWGTPKAYTEGDVHFWGVWWGLEPFENYRARVGRFVSEYGFQSMPEMRSLNKFLPPGQDTLGSPALRQHQKHPLGDSTIRAYMERDYRVPEKPDDFSYVSQLLQARGMKIAMESHRFAQPYCMGSLFWQWNDSWPAISWSAIDYYNQPKALYYQAKRSFAPAVLRFDTVGEQLMVQWTQEQPVADSGFLRLQWMDIEGNLFTDSLLPVKLNGKNVQQLCTLTRAAFSVDSSRRFMLAQLYTGSDTLTAEPFFFLRPKDLDLAEFQLQWRPLTAGKLEIISNSLIKNLRLQAPGYEFEDNYFDLIPGKRTVVSYKTLMGDLPFILSYKSLRDSY